jgi:tetratricopeptide (TPR) repeat protein
MRRAWAREPSDHLACATLAYMLANLGDLEAATAQFERAATLSPTPINFWAALVQLKKLTAADRPLIDKIEAYLRRNGLTDVGRMTLHFALGKANDDLGEYERAMHHFDAANRIRSMLCPFNRDACTREIDGLIAKFSKHFFAEHGGEGLDDETPLLVTGMPRSGTTLVEQMLSSHPQIAGVGELAFWADQYAAMRTAGAMSMEAPGARKAAHDYLKVLRGFSATASRVIDKSLANFHFIGLILHALPTSNVSSAFAPKKAHGLRTQTASGKTHAIC